MRRKRVEAPRVFICHECRVVGAVVDKDSCCTGCGGDLDAYEENVYSLGPQLRLNTPDEARELRALRALRGTVEQFVVGDADDEFVQLKNALARLKKGRGGEC